MSEAITGGCQCGAVRYRIEGQLERPTICHCRMCQKAFGSFFAPLVGARKDVFSVMRGTIAIFRSSDLVERGFCSTCGTPLTFHEIGRDLIDVSIGSLDHPAAAKPVQQYGIEGRMPWFAELAGLPSVTTGEGEGPERIAAIAASNHQHPAHATAAWPPQGEGR